MTVFYKKVGRRYVPVSEYDSEYCDSFPRGNHLVMCYPGGASRRYNIDPAHAPMIAAGRVAEDAVTKAISQAMALRPQRQPITEQQRELWRELAESFGRDDYPLIRSAAADAGRAAVQALIQEADALMQHAAVRQAYEHFLMVCELTKNHDTPV